VSPCIPPDDYAEPDDIGSFKASREAIEAGLLVEVDSEIRVMPKGLAVIAEMMKREGRSRR